MSPFPHKTDFNKLWVSFSFVNNLRGDFTFDDSDLFLQLLLPTKPVHVQTCITANGRTKNIRCLKTWYFT